MKREILYLKKVAPRDAAEYAYALAMLHYREGNLEEAKKFGHEAISLFNQCQTETVEDCAAHNVSIGGIVIPELIHENVVRERLQMLQL